MAASDRTIQLTIAFGLLQLENIWDNTYCSYIVAAKKSMYIRVILKLLLNVCCLYIPNIKDRCRNTEACAIVIYRLKTTWTVWQTFRKLFLGIQGKFIE